MLKSILNRALTVNCLFFCLLLLLFFFFNFHEILFLRPQGIHFARQTDSLAFVTGYYKYGMAFFEPKGLNLLSEGGRGASEFPILYYLTACLYFVFGEKEFILRLINISLVSFGFYYLFKLIRALFQDLFYAFILTYLFLSSTVLLYYTNNFLPDVGALSFTLIAWYFFYKYLSDKKRNSLFLCFLFFTISSLLKITFYINPIAAFLTLIYFGINEKSNPFKFFLKVFWIGFSVNFFWVLYVIYYNQVFGNNYFTTTIRPIWNLPTEAIKYVWSHIYNYWYTKYYFQSTFHLLFFILILGGLLIKRIALKLLIPTLLLLMGSLCYGVLFYEMFQDHDYYVLAILPTLILTVLSCFYAIRSRFPKLVAHYLVKLIFLAICVLSINYAQEKLSIRYLDSKNEASDISNTFDSIKEKLLKFGVDEDSKFIVIEDSSRNGSLYFLNRQGWVFDDFSKLNEAVLLTLIGNGAEYLIVTEKNKQLNNYDSLKELGQINGMLLYKVELKIGSK